jgi:hypothetical protein
VNDVDARRRVTNRVVAVLTIGVGLVMVAIGTGVLSTASTNPNGGRWVVTVMGVAFAAAGVQVGQWLRTGSVMSDVLGALTITALAAAFTWASLRGDASGFSSSAGVAGVTVATRAGVTIGRIAFGFAGVLIGIFAGWAWWRVLRRLF